ncbi:MAG TPA: hypothetical protein VGF79_09795 [Bacteroidia bacterium]
MIITRDNYETVMFGLLENEYPADVREDILQQIEADTFLKFEWGQWSKATYSEGLETYKHHEAEFIEGLTKKDNKGGFIYRMIIPMSMAAALALFFLVRSGNESSEVVGPTISKNQVNTIEKSNIEAPLELKPEKKTAEDKETGKFISKEKNINNIDVQYEEPVFVEVQNENTETIKPSWKQMVEDTAALMVKTALAQQTEKKSKYKVTVVHETMNGLAYENTEFQEKKYYTMADVMNHKDGISLSKFLSNPRSKVIKDKTTNSTYIEYLADDNSVLVLTISN